MKYDIIKETNNNIILYNHMQTENSESTTNGKSVQRQAKPRGYKTFFHAQLS